MPPKRLDGVWIWPEFEVVDVPGKGLGVRARCDVPAGTMIPYSGKGFSVRESKKRNNMFDSHLAHGSS